MTEYARKHAGHECPPDVDPAEQPRKPPEDIKVCTAPDPPEDAPEPPKPDPCPLPDRCCKCPTEPGPTSNCLEDMVLSEKGDVGAAEQAKFKAELTKLLETAKKASQEYTRDKYDELVEKWVKLDAEIAELIRKLECAVWCWKCILDCHVCSLLHELYYAEKRLYDDGQLPDVHDLYDKQYWLQRDRVTKERALNRIKSVLKAWETPAASIEKALNDNKKLVDTIGPLIGSQPGKAIYDVFFKLVPLHLAIAPPAGPDTTTKIDKRYTEFCDCGDHPHDWCCGPEVDEGGFRQRLIPPQAYLIDPEDYFKIICCLVDSRYKPAQNALIHVDEQLAKVKGEIERDVKAVGPGWQIAFEKDAKAAIPSVIDCCKYDKDDDGEESQSLLD